MADIKKMKRVVIKEEFVAITGDFQKAVILNQFIYWAERAKDFDDFIYQENVRAVKSNLQEQDLTYGWIYKTATELSNETMLGLSDASIRSHIKALIEMGFISERNNPKHKWDRTKQYRVNLLNISDALEANGYCLQGYKNAILENENGSEKNSKAIPENLYTTTNLLLDSKSIIKEDNKDYIKSIKYKEDLLNKDSAIYYYINNVNSFAPADILRDIALFLETMSDELVIKACDIALGNHISSWNYIRTILNNWQKKGLRTIIDWQQMEDEYRRKKEQRTNKGKNNNEANVKIGPSGIAYYDEPSDLDDIF